MLQLLSWNIDEFGWRTLRGNSALQANVASFSWLRREKDVTFTRGRDFEARSKVSIQVVLLFLP